LEAILIVDQSKTPFLKQGQRIELKFHQFPTRTFFGEIDEIEKQSISALDIQLSTRARGEIPTTSKPDGSEEPTRATYRVRMMLDNNPDRSIRMGMTGIGKIHVEQQTLGYRLWQLVHETFNFRL
jgi:putative peptide zinc metalloprotease protein